MKVPNGDTVTQFDLGDDEKCSLIKIDLLSVEALDKIQTCMELLIEYGYIKPEKTFKETYEKVLGVYNIERTNPKMWDMVNNHEILSLFQMEQQSGIQGIDTIQPHNVDELAVLNSIIRLMPQDKNAETPINKWARFRKYKDAWDKEMINYGLTKEERDILHKELDVSGGLCIQQEQFMELVQLPECGGWDLQYSDALRKAIAKKSPKDYEQREKEFFERVKEKNLSDKFCKYVWYVQIALSKGLIYRPHYFIKK